MPSETKDIVIVGARNLCRDLLGYIAKGTEWNPVAIIDDGVIEEQELFGIPIYHPKYYNLACRDAFLAIGYPKDKLDILEKMKPLGFSYHSYIDSNAEVSPYAEIGVGSIICPFVLIAADAKIGSFVYMSPYSSVGHSSSVGDYSSLMIHSGIGGSSVAQRCTIGAHSIVINGGLIEDDATVAPYSFVRDYVPARALARGYPARVFKNLAKR